MFFQLMRSSGNLTSLAAYFVALIVAFVVGIGFHEFSHVFVAYLLGDTTGRDRGRLTLNPLAHLDPMGSMMLLFVGFGWGKPAPVDPYKLKTGPATGWALVALAGPASNFLIAALLALVLKIGPLQTAFFSYRWLRIYQGIQLAQSSWADFLVAVIFVCISINILLGTFNLLPIPPLDGYRVALRLLPPNLSAAYQRIEQYGWVILMALFAIPFLTGSRINPISDLIGPVTSWVTRFLLGL